jgi:TPR repeat protein
MLSITLAQATAACGGIAPGINIGSVPGPVFGSSPPTSSDYYELRELRRARASAEKGEPDGQNSLGVYYEFGYGVPQDYAKAAKWYRLAAEQGLALAQNNLGELYDRGLGVMQDYVQADMWFVLAAAGGYGPGSDHQGRIEKLMTPEQIEQAQQLARDWLAKHQQ